MIGAEQMSDEQVSERLAAYGRNGLFDEDLTSDASMSLGMVLPEGQSTLEATVRVSRTWSPSDVGEPDARQLGVGIVADFSKDQAFATNQLRAVKLSGCGGGI